MVVRVTAHTLRRLAGSNAGPLIAYVFDPKFWPYVKPLAADFVVYHAYDLFARFQGYSDELGDYERELAGAADVVIASSEHIARELSTLARKRVVVVPNGVDYDNFALTLRSPDDEPVDLQPIPRPRIGYAGALSRKMDFGLIAELAERRPRWQFTLVGPVRRLDPRADADYRRCLSCANVHFLGGKPYGEIARYVCGMDVNVMSYRLGEGSWVEACYPLKLHEYLAAGAPVVSADLESVRPYANVVGIAHDVDEWEQLIDDALISGGRGDRTQRRSTARANTWDLRVRDIEDLLDGLN